MAGKATTALEQLSEAMAEAVAKAGQSTVTVNARRGVSASGIAWAAGVVVTADHVIERDEEITVGFEAGTEAPAKLAGRDPGTDLAVLRVEQKDMKAIERRVEAMRVGEVVLAVGRPGPGGAMASLGIVSALEGPWRTRRGGKIEGLIRTEATLYPGFSGGPLIDASGRMVGLNTSGPGRGAGLAIPVADVGRVVALLLKHGRVSRGYLGIGSQPARISEAQAAKLGRAQETGLLVVSVEAGSPAEGGGLLVGDILVSLGDESLRDTSDLQTQLGPESVGQATPVVALRGGEPVSLTVTVGERE
jgi:S1-C subfamily serine protease